MSVEEVLYSAMEDFYIDIMIGAGEGSRSVHLSCHLLPDWCDDSGWYALKSLRARFGITGHMEYYAHTDLTEIVERTADILRWKSLMRQHLSWPYVVVGPRHCQSSLSAYAILPRLWEWGDR